MAITTVVSALSAAVGAADLIKKLKDPETRLAAGAGAVGKAGSKISEMSAKSLVEFSGVARVEPITAIDASLVPYDFTTDVLKLCNSVFTGFYLSSAALATDVGDIKTTMLLDKLNPSRNMAFNVANSILLPAAQSALTASHEDIREDLAGIVDGRDCQETPPVVGGSVTIKELTDDDINESDLPVAPLTPFSMPRYSAESDLTEVVSKDGVDDKNKNKNGKDDRKEDKGAIVSGFKSGVDLTTVANLSVGQTVTMTVGDGNVKRDIPITVRLITYPTQPRVLARILNWSERDNSFKTRYASWRAGELSFWRDIVFMRDIFAETKKALIQDKSGLYQTLTSRNVNNMAAGVVSATPSLGTISSILVVSEDTVRQAEENMYGRLSDFRVRQRIMNATGIMLIAVVNPRDEFVTLYTYSIALPSEFSIRQVKSGTKGSGPDISEIIKLIQAGTPPSF